MKTAIEMPNEVFNQLNNNVALAKEMAHSHTCCDQSGKFMHYCTMIDGNRYKTTLEQKEAAKVIHEANKANVIKQIGNKLVFVGMGMNYKERYSDDVCNHRIRTEIINPEGKRFFIEVGTWGNELMRIDHVVNRDQEDEYAIKAQEYRNKIELAGGFWRIGKGHELYEKYQQYMSQPYYWYKKEEWTSLRTKYTKENVIKLVNKLFDCKFTEMEVDYYHLNCDDYSSVSPK